jgi:molybdopterin-guanine dinucleotide biosynthesis protein A
MSEQSNVTLAVLAGGRGERMGGPKSGLVIGRRPILEYLLDRFGWEGPTMLVTGIGNEKPVGCERFDVEVTDSIAGQGPLRGVLTGLENCGTELMAVVTVDMPGVTGEMVGRLIGEIQRDVDAMGAMYERMIDGVARIEPFPCVLRRGILAVVQRRVLAGKRSARGLCEEEVKVVEAGAGWGEGVWRNLNFPGDLER